MHSIYFTYGLTDIAGDIFMRKQDKEKLNGKKIQPSNFFLIISLN